MKVKNISCFSHADTPAPNNAESAQTPRSLPAHVPGCPGRPTRTRVDVPLVTGKAGDGGRLGDHGRAARDEWGMVAQVADLLVQAAHGLQNLPPHSVVLDRLRPLLEAYEAEAPVALNQLVAGRAADAVARAQRGLGLRDVNHPPGLFCRGYTNQCRPRVARRSTASQRAAARCQSGVAQPPGSPVFALPLTASRAPNGCSALDRRLRRRDAHEARLVRIAGVGALGRNPAGDMALACSCRR